VSLSADDYTRLRRRFLDPTLTDQDLVAMRKEVGEHCLLCLEINQRLACASARLLGLARTRPELVQAYELAPSGSNIQDRIFRAMIQYDIDKYEELTHLDMILTYMESPYMEPDIKEKFRLKMLLIKIQKKTIK
jgi:hypothetical protein